MLLHRLFFIFLVLLGATGCCSFGQDIPPSKTFVSEPIFRKDYIEHFPTCIGDMCNTARSVVSGLYRSNGNHPPASLFSGKLDTPYVEGLYVVGFIIPGVFMGLSMLLFFAFCFGRACNRCGGRIASQTYKEGSVTLLRIWAGIWMAATSAVVVLLFLSNHAASKGVDSSILAADVSIQKLDSIIPHMQSALALVQLRQNQFKDARTVLQASNLISNQLDQGVFANVDQCMATATSELTSQAELNTILNDLSRNFQTLDEPTSHVESIGSSLSTQSIYVANRYMKADQVSFQRSGFSSLGESPTSDFLHLSNLPAYSDDVNNSISSFTNNGNNDQLRLSASEVYPKAANFAIGFSYLAHMPETFLRNSITPLSGSLPESVNASLFSVQDLLVLVNDAQGIVSPTVDPNTVIRMSVLADRIEKDIPSLSVQECRDVKSSLYRITETVKHLALTADVWTSNQHRLSAVNQMLNVPNYTSTNPLNAAGASIVFGLGVADVIVKQTSLLENLLVDASSSGLVKQVELYLSDLESLLPTNSLRLDVSLTDTVRGMNAIRLFLESLRESPSMLENTNDTTDPVKGTSFQKLSQNHASFQPYQVSFEDINTKLSDIISSNFSGSKCMLPILQTTVDAGECILTSSSAQVLQSLESISTLSIQNPNILSNPDHPALRVLHLLKQNLESVSLLNSLTLQAMADTLTDFVTFMNTVNPQTLAEQLSKSMLESLIELTEDFRMAVVTFDIVKKHELASQALDSMKQLQADPSILQNFTIVSQILASSLQGIQSDYETFSTFSQLIPVHSNITQLSPDFISRGDAIVRRVSCYDNNNMFNLISANDRSAMATTLRNMSTLLVNFDSPTVQSIVSKLDTTSQNLNSYSPSSSTLSHLENLSSLFSTMTSSTLPTDSQDAISHYLVLPNRHLLKTQNINSQSTIQNFDDSLSALADSSVRLQNEFSVYRDALIQFTTSLSDIPAIRSQVLFPLLAAFNVSNLAINREELSKEAAGYLGLSPQSYVDQLLPVSELSSETFSISVSPLVVDAQPFDQKLSTDITNYALSLKAAIQAIPASPILDQIQKDFQLAEVQTQTTIQEIIETKRIYYKRRGGIEYKGLIADEQRLLLVDIPIYLIIVVLLTSLFVTIFRAFKVSMFVSSMLWPAMWIFLVLAAGHTIVSMSLVDSCRNPSRSVGLSVSGGVTSATVMSGFIAFLGDKTTTPLASEDLTSYWLKCASPPYFINTIQTVATQSNAPFSAPTQGMDVQNLQNLKNVLSTQMLSQPVKVATNLQSSFSSLFASSKQATPVAKALFNEIQCSATRSYLESFEQEACIETAGALGLVGILLFILSFCMCPGTYLHIKAFKQFNPKNAYEYEPTMEDYNEQHKVKGLEQMNQTPTLDPGVVRGVGIMSAEHINPDQGTGDGNVHFQSKYNQPYPSMNSTPKPTGLKTGYAVHQLKGFENANHSYFYERKQEQGQYYANSLGSQSPLKLPENIHEDSSVPPPPPYEEEVYSHHPSKTPKTVVPKQKVYFDSVTDRQNFLHSFADGSFHTKESIELDER